MSISRRQFIQAAPIALAVAPLLSTNITPTQAYEPRGYHVLDYPPGRNIFTQDVPIQTAKATITELLETKNLATLNVMDVTAPTEYIGAKITISSGTKFIGRHHNQHLGYGWGKQVFTLYMRAGTGERVRLFTTTAVDAVTGESVQAAWAGVMLGDTIVYLVKTYADCVADVLRDRERVLWENVWEDRGRVVRPGGWYTFYGDDFGQIEYWW
jgi:hypothetical protein